MGLLVFIGLIMVALVGNWIYEWRQERRLLYALKLEGFITALKTRVGDIYAVCNIDKREIAILQRGGRTPLLRANEWGLRGAEIVADQQHYSKRGVGSLAGRGLMGYFIFGPLGGVVGAMSAPSKSVTYSRYAELRIKTRSLGTPVLYIPIFDERTGPMERKRRMAGAEKIKELVNALTDYRG